MASPSTSAASFSFIALLICFLDALLAFVSEVPVFFFLDFFFLEEVGEDEEEPPLTKRERFSTNEDDSLIEGTNNEGFVTIAWALVLK